MTQGPNPLANSHEGPHLFRYNMPKVFSVFYNGGMGASLAETGWYWEGEDTHGRTTAYGPFNNSALAFVDAKAHCPPDYNPRHLPSIYGQLSIYPDMVVHWTVQGNGPLVLASWYGDHDYSL